MLLGYHQRGRGREGRELECPGDAGNGHEAVHRPLGEHARLVEDEYAQGRDGGHRVGDDHDGLAIVPVDEDPREGTEHDLRSEGEQEQEGHRGGLSGGLEEPDEEHEDGHPRADEGDELPRPEDGVAPHLPKSCEGSTFLGLLFGHINHPFKSKDSTRDGTQCR